MNRSGLVQQKTHCFKLQRNWKNIVPSCFLRKRIFKLKIAWVEKKPRLIELNIVECYGRFASKAKDFLIHTHFQFECAYRFLYDEWNSAQVSQIPANESKEIIVRSEEPLFVSEKEKPKFPVKTARIVCQGKWRFTDGIENNQQTNPVLYKRNTRINLVAFSKHKYTHHTHHTTLNALHAISNVKVLFG